MFLVNSHRLEIKSGPAFAGLGANHQESVGLSGPSKSRPGFPGRKTKFPSNERQGTGCRNYGDF